MYFFRPRVSDFSHLKEEEEEERRRRRRARSCHGDRIRSTAVAAAAAGVCSIQRKKQQESQKKAQSLPPLSCVLCGGDASTLDISSFSWFEVMCAPSPGRRNAPLPTNHSPTHPIFSYTHTPTYSVLLFDLMLPPHAQFVCVSCRFPLPLSPARESVKGGQQHQQQSTRCYTGGNEGWLTTERTTYRPHVPCLMFVHTRLRSLSTCFLHMHSYIPSLYELKNVDFCVPTSLSPIQLPTLSIRSKRHPHPYISLFSLVYKTTPKTQCFIHSVLLFLLLLPKREAYGCPPCGCYTYGLPPGGSPTSRHRASESRQCTQARAARPWARAGRETPGSGPWRQRQPWRKSSCWGPGVWVGGLSVLGGGMDEVTFCQVGGWVEWVNGKGISLVRPSV